ncbi:hypothetical protein RP20_CCG022761 [Aedes albopictus]|nr:hypothetical protein RP20_CCG022761 [Aedes albopictus]
MRCLVCNRTGHLRKDCRYRNLTCNKCNKKGHLQAACGNQQAFYVTTAERADREEDLDNESSIELEQNYISKSTISVNKIASTEEEGFKVEVRIANQVHRMEIDSGAGVCVFPESLYRESLSSYQLKETSLKLMLYSGQRLQVIGAITPVIEYNGSCRTVLVAIVKENGPALLGKNFMKAFGIRLALVNKVVTGTEEKLAKLLDKYSGLFSDELGKYKYETVSLEVEETARPVFKKPRQVPFKFQEKMIRDSRVVAQRHLQQHPCKYGCECNLVFDGPNAEFHLSGSRHKQYSAPIALAGLLIRSSSTVVNAGIWLNHGVKENTVLLQLVYNNE